MTQVVWLVFLYILYVAGSLSFSGSCSGTKHVFGISQWSIHELHSALKKCNTVVPMVWLLSPHCFMLQQSITANESLCFMHCISLTSTHKEQAAAAFCSLWIILIYPFTCLVVHCPDVLFLSLWSTAIPSSDAKNANLYFLDVVQQANSIFHLFDKQFNDQLMPLIRSVKG